MRFQGIELQRYEGNKFTIGFKGRGFSGHGHGGLFWGREWGKEHPGSALISLLALWGRKLVF